MHIFFGNTDGLTLHEVSKRAGNNTADDVTAPLGAPAMVHQRDPMELSEGLFFKRPVHQNPGEDVGRMGSRLRTEDENTRRYMATLDAKRRNEYEHQMRQVGRPRITPEEIAALTGKGDGDKVARSMIVFAPRGAVLNLKLAPYFEFIPERDPDFVPHAGRVYASRDPDPPSGRVHWAWWQVKEAMQTAGGLAVGGSLLALLIWLQFF